MSNVWNLTWYICNQKNTKICYLITKYWQIESTKIMLPVADIQQLAISFFLNCFTCHIPNSVDFYFPFFFSMQLQIGKNKIKFYIWQVILEPLFVSYFDQLIIKTIKSWNCELNSRYLCNYIFTSIKYKCTGQIIHACMQ